MKDHLIENLERLTVEELIDLTATLHDRWGGEDEPRRLKYWMQRHPYGGPGCTCRVTPNVVYAVGCQWHTGAVISKLGAALVG